MDILSLECLLYIYPCEVDDWLICQTSCPETQKMEEGQLLCSRAEKDLVRLGEYSKKLDMWKEYLKTK